MKPDPTRRGFLRAAAGAAALAMTGCSKEAVEAFIHQRLEEKTPAEMEAFIAELEKEYRERFGRDVSIDSTPAQEGVLFAYGLDLGRCNGNRLCVQACVEENNQSRPNPDGEHTNEIHWITVLRMEKAKGIDLDHSTAYYDPESVPEPGFFYFPVACQQCENPSCVKSCPVKATWQEPDGIVVIDYDQCIGCRCCMSACPYGARSFNWCEPHLPAAELNPQMHVLGNRPRMRGVVEKCSFCVQRVRKGSYPACHDACPTGARVFGNLLDPESEIRRLIERKRVFILKAELNTRPKFFYFYG